jgi:signal transduction histidine kinase/DNA-binding response OmpR family regulator
MTLYLNMKKLLLPVLLLISLSSFSQPAGVDSLENLLADKSLKETIRIDVLNELAYLKRSDLAVSIVYAREALALAKRTGYEKGEAAASNAFSFYYWSKMENEKSLKYALSALRIFESLNDKKGLTDTYTLIGLIYLNLKETDKAEKYFNLALPLSIESKNNEAIGRGYNSLGVVALARNDRKEALRLYEKALSYLQSTANTPIKVIVLCNVGMMHRLNGDTQKAFPYLFEGLQIASDLDDKSGQALAHFSLGRTYMKLRELTKAEEHLLTGQRLSLQAGEKKHLFNIYMALIELKMITDNNQEAHQYQVKYYKARDSIFTIEKTQQIAELEISYETEKREQTIKLLEQENKIKSLSRNLLLAGLTSVVLIGGLIFYFQRQKNRRNKELLKKQEHLNQKLQEADQLKSHFFANISHEFRTPLTLILSPVEEKLSAGNLSQKDTISFQSIRRSANRLLELINQLLELSKLESGFMKLHMQPGNLYDFVIPILTSFDSLADVNQSQYTKEIRIPTFTVLFDGDKLEKILNNLLSNAFKFSPTSGKVHIKVDTQEKERSIELTIEIRNSGAVIPSDSLPRIFDPFVQGENTSSLPGTGLGLSLVKELVKLHGGDIIVSSNTDIGTVFMITLMFERSDLPDALPATEKRETIPYSSASFENDAAETDPAKETILVVEDNQEVRSLIRRGLENHYNILEASTGKEGIALAREHHIDLAVSDVMMPEMNGVALCHLLKNDELTSHIPVILLTARADHESKLEGLRTGADDYVIKPFNMQELLARITNLIDLRRKLIQKYNQRIVIQPHEITVTPLDERFIQKVIQLVEDNLDNTSLSVEKMSAELGISRANLHRKLKAITGLATSEFIQDFRLRRAAQLIEKKADTISQIAYQVGFNDQSYFTKCFKKKFGKTPSEYGLPVSSEV